MRRGIITEEIQTAYLIENKTTRSLIPFVRHLGPSPLPHRPSSLSFASSFVQPLHTQVSHPLSIYLSNPPSLPPSLLHDRLVARYHVPDMLKRLPAPRDFQQLQRLVHQLRHTQPSSLPPVHFTPLVSAPGMYLVFVEHGRGAQEVVIERDEGRADPLWVR